MNALRMGVSPRGCVFRMPSFDSTDLDNATSESGVVHQSTTNTDHTDASELKQGYDYANFSEITPTPVACYPLHEDSGTTAYDLAGTNDGTINGATVGAEGLLGTTSYSFDGVDDNVTYASNPLITGSSNRTVCFWTKMDSSQNDTYPTMFGMGGGSQTTGERWDIRPDAGTLRIEVQGAGYSSSLSIPTGEWVFICITLNGSTVGDHTFYVNTNSESSTGTTSLNTAGGGTYSADSAFSSDRSYAGDITDVRIYDHALTASEIQTLYDVVATAGTLTTAFKPV